MTQNDSFDLLIQRVTSAAKLDPAAGSLIIVDVREKRVVGRWAVAMNPLLEVEYYVVADPLDKQRLAAGTLTAFGVRDNRTGHTLNLSVKYTARCVPGEEGKLAVALSRGGRPGAKFRALVEMWMSDYVKQGPEVFVSEFFEKKGELESYISKRARDEAGLSLEVEILLTDAADIPATVAINLVDLGVHMMGCDDEEKLTLTAKLSLDEQYLVNAYLARLDEAQLKEWLGDQVRKYFATSITLSGYYDAVSNRTLPELLKAYLSPALRTAGRRIDFLSVAGSVQRQKIFHKHLDVVFRIPGRAEEIVINNDVLMICHDPASYRNAGSPELEDWLLENLTEIVTLKLFKPYIELLLDFELLKAEMKEELSRRTGEIGWKVEQLIATPDLEPYRWLKNFTIEPENEFKVKQSNSTANSPVRLRVGVTAKIKRLQDVAEYLSSGKSVPEAMKKAVLEEVRQSLQKVELARFYMRFDVSDVPGEEPVSQLLETRIRTMLTERFRADVSLITPEILETPLDPIFEGLRGMIREFKVTLSNPREPGSVVLSGDIQVEAIDIEETRFEKFLMMAHGLLGGDKLQLEEKLNEIKAQLEKNLLSELEGGSLRSLVQLDVKSLKEYVRAIAKKYVAEKYGLVIDVSNVRRELFEPQGREDSLLEGIIRKQKELLYKLIAAGSDPEEIGEAVRSIALLESYRQPSAPASVWDRHAELPAPAPDENMNLLAAPSRASDDEDSWLETDTEA